MRDRSVQRADLRNQSFFSDRNRIVFSSCAKHLCHGKVDSKKKKTRPRTFVFFMLFKIYTFITIFAIMREKAVC